MFDNYLKIKYYDKVLVHQIYSLNNVYLAELNFITDQNTCLK